MSRTVFVVDDRIQSDRKNRRPLAVLNSGKVSVLSCLRIFGLFNRFNKKAALARAVLLRSAEGSLRLEKRSLTSLAVLIVVMELSISVAAQKVIVDSDPAHVANTFSPVHSLGAAIDRLRTGTPDHLLKDPLLKEILGAGWQTVTYRQNTELMVEAWHWNPAGKWSNSEKQEGYFVGNAEPGEEIHSSWASPLPHRGFSRGDGNGWSRLTDGDIHSYWKSNPYLTKGFTGEDDSLHPQWNSGRENSNPFTTAR
jgi:hypothetical protein